MIRISVIGNTSFLGTHFCSYCKKNKDKYHVTGYSRTPQKETIDEWKKFNYPIEIFDFQHLLTQDVIIYSAGAGIQSSKKESVAAIYGLNTFFPIKLLSYLKANNYKGKVITFGSYFEIGYNSQDKKFVEEDIIFSMRGVPNNYCKSKRLLSRFIYDSQSNLKHLHLILPTIYGFGEDNNRLIPYLISCINNDSDINLTNGEQIRQYLHIKDLMNLITLFLHSSEFPLGIYNVSSSETISIKDLVDLVLSTYDGKNEINWGQVVRQDAGMFNLQLDDIKIKDCIDWKPTVSLNKGILDY